MITPEQEYYVRCILLLLQGGTNLLRKIVEKALRAKNETLNQFLKSIENTVSNLERKKKQHLTQIQKATLYPATPQGASIEALDITLLSYLIITHLQGYVDLDEVSATEKIRDARNAYLHSTESKIETLEYIKEWSALAQIILTVGSGISPEVERKHKDIIDSISCKSQLETESILEVIKNHDPSKEFLVKIQKQLEETMANTDNIQKGQEQLAVAVQNLQNTEENTNAYIKDIKEEVKMLRSKHDHQEKVLEVILSTLILGKVQIQPDDEETNDKFITSLGETCKRFDANLPPNGPLQAMTFKLCHELKDRGIKLHNIKSGCIQFEFKCLSLKEVLELTEYFYSQTFQTHIDNIAAAFEEVTRKRISLTANGIIRQSLRDVIRNMDELDMSSDEQDLKAELQETKADVPVIKEVVPYLLENSVEYILMLLELTARKMGRDARIKHVKDVLDRSSNEPGSKEEMSYTSEDKLRLSLEEMKRKMESEARSKDVLDTPSHEPDTKDWAQERKANVLDIKEELPYSSEDKLDVSEQMKLKMESEESIKDVLDTPSLESDTKAWAQEMKANVLDITEELPYSSEDKLDVSEQMKLKMESEESIKAVTEVQAEVMKMKHVLLQLKEQELRGNPRRITKILQLKEQELRGNPRRITKIVQTKYGKVCVSADDQETLDVAEATLLKVADTSHR